MQAFVKVSMDGTPYLRKVDVAAYDDYGELVEALNEMFCCASIGACTVEIDQAVKINADGCICITSVNKEKGFDH
jgi:hypothetical protein